MSSNAYFSLQCNSLLNRIPLEIRSKPGLALLIYHQNKLDHLRHYAVNECKWVDELLMMDMIEDSKPLSQIIIRFIGIIVSFKRNITLYAAEVAVDALLGVQ